MELDFQLRVCTPIPMDSKQSLTCKIEPFWGMDCCCIESINPRQTVRIDHLSLGINGEFVCVKELI